MSEALTHDEEAAVLERYTRNQLAIVELEAEQEQLKSFFKERTEQYPAGTKTVRGKFFIKVTANTRLDDALAKKALPTNIYNRVTKTTLDTRRARALLTEEQLDSVTKKFENRIEIGLAE